MSFVARGLGAIYSTIVLDANSFKQDTSTGHVQSDFITHTVIM